MFVCFGGGNTFASYSRDRTFNVIRKGSTDIDCSVVGKGHQITAGVQIIGDPWIGRVCLIKA